MSGEEHVTGGEPVSREEGGESPPAESAADAHVEEYEGVGTRLRKTLRRDKKALFGVIVILLFVFVAAFAPYVAPHDPGADYDIMEGPNSYSTTTDGERVYHAFGTDSYGYDVLSRIVFGARVSLLVALATVLFAFTVGTTIGLAAGFYGGWVDNLLMRYVDFQWAFPTLILAAGIIAVSGSLGVVNVIVAVGVAFIDDFARLIRSEVLSIREQEYITAARAIGMSDWRIMVREILPNAVASLIVQVTLLIPLAILAEAGLSFLGLGVKPTTPTWGLMLNEGRQFITQAWWISIFPGFAIMFVVLAFNMFGDGLRDAFDVRETEVGGE